MPEQIDQKEMLKKVREFVVGNGNQTAAARELGISNAFMSDILHEARPVPDKVARVLGYKRVVVYQVVSDGPQ